MVDVAGAIARAFVEQEAAAEIARANAIQERWRAYYGEFPKPLKTKAGETDDNVIVNKARVIVDKSVSFLAGEDIGFELDSESERNEDEDWLDAVWRANRKMTTLAKLFTNGAIAGHAFLKIVPGARLTAPFPRVVVLDPETVTVYWSDDDIDDVYKYRIQYNGMDAAGKGIVVRQVHERGESGDSWTITDQWSYRDNPTWHTTNTDVWPYPFAAIADCQNLPVPNVYWGMSDLERDILTLNRAVNFNLSNWFRVLRFFAHPKVWGRGFNPQNMQWLSTAVDDLVVIPSESGVLEVLKAFGDSAGSSAMHRELVQAIHEIASVPEVATGKVDNLGPLSGVALAILYQPLLEKTEKKRRLYGDLLADVNRRLMVIGKRGSREIPVKVNWPDVLPVNETEQAEVLLTHNQLGASKDTILQKLGYDPEIEASKREREAKEAAERAMAAFDAGAGQDTGEDVADDGEDEDGEDGA